jgi:hypothetical protein
MDSFDIYDELSLIQMQEDLESNLVHIGYSLERLPNGDPKRKLLISMEHSISSVLDKIEQLWVLKVAG